METLQSLSKRITSITKLQGIVKSMKTLAAVSIRQYERALKSLDSFVEVIDQGLMVALRETPLPHSPSDSPEAPRVIVVFGSDQGLCGRFNERLDEFINDHLRTHKIEAKRLKLLVIGARIGSRLEASGLVITEQFWVPGSVSGINMNVYQVLLTLEQWLSQDRIRHVEIFYNRYERLTAAEPSHEVLLPLDKGHLQSLASTPWQGPTLPYHRIRPDKLFSGLVRQYLMVSLFRAQAESLASEQASRLRSLQGAEKNIEEHVDELQGEFRIKRQTTVTSELLDLVAGYKAALSTNNS